MPFTRDVSPAQQCLKIMGSSGVIDDDTVTRCSRVLRTFTRPETERYMRDLWSRGRTGNVPDRDGRSGQFVAVPAPRPTTLIIMSCDEARVLGNHMMSFMGGIPAEIPTDEGGGPVMVFADVAADALCILQFSMYELIRPYVDRCGDLMQQHLNLDARPPFLRIFVNWYQAGLRHGMQTHTDAHTSLGAVILALFPDDNAESAFYTENRNKTDRVHHRLMAGSALCIGNGDSHGVPDVSRDGDRMTVNFFY